MKTRILHTRFWQDSFISQLPRHEKLLFVYLLTNEKVNISGIYELPDKYIIADLELSAKELDTAKQKFQRFNKIIFYDGWIKIVNADKYNSFNGEKLEKAKEKELALVPTKLIDYQESIDTSIDTSIDSLNNNNNKDNNKYNKKGNKKYENPDWLKNIEKDEMDKLIELTELKAETIQRKALEAYSWWEVKPNDKSRKGRNWRATLLNWIRRDIDQLKASEVTTSKVLDLSGD